ncbi:MAG: thioesterase family protein [Bacteroidota bacterium]
MSQSIDYSLFRFNELIATRWSDFDQLGHANNAVYSTYIETGRIHYLEQVGPWPWKVTGMVLARTEMDFLREMLPKHTPRLYMRVSRLGTKSLDFESIICQDGEPELVFNRAKVVVVAIDNAAAVTTAIPEEMRTKFIDFEPGLG